MRCSDRLRGQRGFTLMEVMTAALILSALVVSIGGGWVVADRETSNLIIRQKTRGNSNLALVISEMLADKQESFLGKSAIPVVDSI